MLEGNRTKPGDPPLSKILWLVAPAWIALAVELLGGWRFSMDTYSGRYAIELGSVRDLVVFVTLGAVILSPSLVALGFVFAIRDRAPDGRRRRTFPILLFLLALSFLLSMFNCAWSCSGHPTWTSGYK